MKTCVKCGTEKPFEEFHKRPSSKDGHRNTCKICKKVDDSRNRKVRLSDPGAAQKERERLNIVRASMSGDRRKQDNERSLALWRDKRDKRAVLFFEENGCTQEEFARRKEEQEFVEGSLLANGDKYDYSSVEYVNTRVPVKILCNVHMKYFNQTPKDHKNGRGCMECGKKSTGDKLRKSQNDFLKEAEGVCGNKYTFENVVYKDNTTPVDVTCTVHGGFLVRPGNLLSGRGCPKCTKNGYNSGKPGHLYVLTCANLVKVGITNRTVTTRSRDISKSNGSEFVHVHDTYFYNGQDALDIETTLLRELRATHTQPAEKFDGSTECFYNVDQEWLLARINELIKEHYGNRPDQYNRST